MPRTQRTQQGVTYIALLLGVAITSAGVAAGGTLWSQVQRREREKQLLWAGDQMRKAIVAYSQFATDPANRFPRELQDLLLDPRSSAPRRYLRQVYEDPITRSTEWGLIRNPQGRIVGVHSRAKGVPLKTGKFGARVHELRSRGDAMPIGASAQLPSRAPRLRRGRSRRRRRPLRSRRCQRKRSNPQCPRPRPEGLCPAQASPSRQLAQRHRSMFL